MSDLLRGKLENQEIRKELSVYKFSSGFNLSENLINSILEQFWFHDFYNSLISDPVFLNNLLQYLNKTNPNKFNRYNFYEFIFEQLLKDPKDRQILQKMALVFEMLQVDATDIAHYKGILKAVEASGDMFSISWMEKNHLAKIGDRESKTLFIWEHHTLTEFLVAELLLEKENFLEEFQKLAILEQEGITAFKSSWSGVLRFLMESKKSPEINIFLVEFLEKNPSSIDDNLSELLVYEAVDQTPQIKSRIFKLVYESYFKRIIWLPVWARNRLSKFVIEKEIYSRLKEDIKEWSNKTESFVRKGNAVSIIEGLFENRSPLITETERKFWQEKLIDFANNPNDDGNGVLQRHSLAVLAYFKDEKIIPLVVAKCFEETQDTLLRDEFIQFCSESSPNSTNTIDVLIKGIKKGSSIYARYGLYKITTKSGIDYLLSQISTDEEFLKGFLEHESIFDKEGADKELLETIEKHADATTIVYLKKLVFTIFRLDGYYKEDQSNFTHQIAKIIKRLNPKYVFEVLDNILSESDESKIDRLFYDSKELIAILLSKDNVKRFFEYLDKFPDRSKNDAQYMIYSAKRLNGQVGEQVYLEAVNQGLVQEVEVPSADKNQTEKRKLDIYESIVNQLEPSPGKFMPSVFKYFLENRKEIEDQWNDKDRKRLTILAVDEGIRKIDPRQFRLKIESRYEGNNKFTWSSQASYFGDIIEIVKEIAPDEIGKYRQKIIDYIPFEFSTGATLEFIEELKDEELDFVNKVMSDKKDDRRYLIPQTYIYLVGEYAKRGCKLPSVKSILRSFVVDPEIQDYYQQAALEALTFFIDQSDIETKDFLIGIFENSKDQKLVNISNAILITVYKNEDAINWRLEKLKKPLEFSSRDLLNEGLAHEVGPVEDELDNMALAKPLIDLGDEKYLPKFIDLIEYSFKVLEKNRDKKYWDYVNYLWRIVIAFVETLKEKGSFKPLLALEDWISKNTTYESSNWLFARVKELRKNYINSIGKANI